MCKPRNSLLTAGIAHEIKNPLNFVNNFAALSVELVDELDDVLKPAALDNKTREGTEELTQMLKGNLEKVVQHGQRADSIVKNMLLHSREGSGKRSSVDLNTIVEDSLNLAYHGARAEKQEFNIRLERSFDPAVRFTPTSDWIVDILDRQLRARNGLTQSPHVNEQTASAARRGPGSWRSDG